MGQPQSRPGQSRRLFGRSTDGGVAEGRSLRKKKRLAIARNNSLPKVIDTLAERSPLLPTTVKQIDEDISATFAAAAKARTLSTNNREETGQEIAQEVKDERAKAERLSQRNFKLQAVTGALVSGILPY